MQHVHRPKHKVCVADKKTDLPWIEFLRLILIVAALIFFGMALSLLIGDPVLMTTSMHVLERIRHTALRVPLDSLMLNWNVMTEMHSVLGTTRTYPVSTESCFVKEKSSDSAVLCNPLAWQQTYLCDLSGEIQHIAVQNYLRGMGWAYDENSVNYFLEDYKFDEDSGLKKHTIKTVCSQQRIYDTVLVHNDPASISLITAFRPPSSSPLSLC